MLGLISQAGHCPGIYLGREKASKEVDSHERTEAETAQVRSQAGKGKGAGNMIQRSA